LRLPAVLPVAATGPLPGRPRPPGWGCLRTVAQRHLWDTRRCAGRRAHV